MVEVELPAINWQPIDAYTTFSFAFSHYGSDLSVTQVDNKFKLSISTNFSIGNWGFGVTVTE